MKALNSALGRRSSQTRFSEEDGSPDYEELGEGTTDLLWWLPMRKQNKTKNCSE